MTNIVLNSKTISNIPLQATFSPENGMNMISFKWGDVELIDSSTRALFEERSAGLGALIGPHFHRRQPEIIPKIADESLFPHIARIRAKGVTDPFSHGIARYAPWKVSVLENSFSATLSGKDIWNGVSLSVLEGQNFIMNYKGSLDENGLHLKLDVVSDTDSLVGTHFYYQLPQQKGFVRSLVKEKFLDGKEQKIVPENWKDQDKKNKHALLFDLDNEADFTFHPFPNPLEGTIILDTLDYLLQINYKCPCQQNCWQLYHPKGASFVCIEPISAANPRNPNLTVSQIEVNINLQQKSI